MLLRKELNVLEYCCVMIADEKKDAPNIDVQWWKNLEKYFYVHIALSFKA